MGLRRRQAYSHDRFPRRREADLATENGGKIGFTEEIDDRRDFEASHYIRPTNAREG
jgi:hypothetical protein